MSKYWVYIDDKVAGPYTVDQLIRLRGFSRQARICSQEGNEGPQHWTSPADIPELSHIFKAVEETRPVMLPPRPKAKPPVPKARPRPAPEAPPEPVRPRKRSFPWAGVGVTLLLCALAAGGYFLWRQSVAHGLENERLRAKQLVENVAVTTPTGPLPFKQFMLQKNIQPRWDYERQPTDLYNVSVIWFEAGANGIPSSIVNAFEVNLEAQTVRPLNSAAAKLFTDTEGSHKSPQPMAKPKAPDFKEALGAWQTAVENGDFEAVWDTFSERKIQDMRKGGISHSGFVRLQTLTHKLEAGNQINVLKTKSDGNDTRLVLLKQTQKGQADVFIRQNWITENGRWKLDDEQKKAAPTPGAESQEDPTSSVAAGAAAKVPVTSLPGISH